MRNSVLLSLFLAIFNYSFAQTLTNGGDEAIVDDYGHVSYYQSNGTQIVEYGSLFMAINGNTPIEFASGTSNLSVYDNDPAPPAGVEPFYFLPARFEDWTFDGASDDECHAVLTYYAAADSHMVVGIGRRLYGHIPDGPLDLDIAAQITNVGTAAATVKGFNYWKTKAGLSSAATFYGSTYDGVNGTSDDYAYLEYGGGGDWYMFFAGYPPAHYRIAGAATDIYDSIRYAGAGYNLPNGTSPVSGQCEIAWQLDEVALESGQSVIYWLPPKPIKIWNTSTNYPTNFDFHSESPSGTGLVEFAGTDVSIDYTAVALISGAVDMDVTVAEITGGMIEGGNGVLHSVLHNRYWEIFYDTRRSSSTADITFNYDIAVDGIIDENPLTIAYRTDYTSAWTEWSDVQKDVLSNTITASGVDMGDAQWALAYNDVPLAVEATAFTATTQAGSVTLEWITHSEVHNAGFNVLRQDPGTDSFVLVAGYKSNNTLRGLGTSSSGKSYSFTDFGVEPGSTYRYRIQSVSTSGETEDLSTLSVTVTANNPGEYALDQNYPNPFNPTTTIRFEVMNPGFVELNVYDVFGRELKTLVSEVRNAGRYEVKFDASDLASGVYFYRIKAGVYTAVKQMVLVK